MNDTTRDLIGGLVLLGLGLGVLAYAQATLRMGTLARMGPGFYPTLLGGLLAMLGAAQAGLAGLRLRRVATARAEVPAEAPNWRALVLVLAGLAAFAAMVRPAGLLPALVVLILIASRADGRLRLPAALVLALAVSTLAIALFRFGLGLPFPVLTWPVRI